MTTSWRHILRWVQATYRELTCGHGWALACCAECACSTLPDILAALRRFWSLAEPLKQACAVTLRGPEVLSGDHDRVWCAWVRTGESTGLGPVVLCCSGRLLWVPLCLTSQVGGQEKCLTIQVGSQLGYVVAPQELHRCYPNPGRAGCQTQPQLTWFARAPPATVSTAPQLQTLLSPATPQVS